MGVRQHMTLVRHDFCTTEGEIWTKRSSTRLPTIALGVTETWSGIASYHLSTVYCDVGLAEEQPDIGWRGVKAHNQMTAQFLGSMTFAQRSSRSHDSHPSHHTCAICDLVEREMDMFSRRRHNHLVPVGAGEHWRMSISQRAGCSTRCQKKQHDPQLPTQSAPSIFSPTTFLSEILASASQAIPSHVR
jgi:hypothetical protein